MADGNFLLYVIPALEIVVSICSIGVSAYQFQSTTEGIPGSNSVTNWQKVIVIFKSMSLY